MNRFLNDIQTEPRDTMTAKLRQVIQILRNNGKKIIYRANPKKINLESQNKLNKFFYDFYNVLRSLSQSISVFLYSFIFFVHNL